MRTDTDTLVAALRILSRDIESGDGVANAAIAEGADRIEELAKAHYLVLTKYRIAFAALATIRSSRNLTDIASRAVQECIDVGDSSDKE